MYSRAVRKFATDPNDRYPNVAPGVYTKEMELNEYGKRTDLQTSYAPFASLTPKMSVFEEQPLKNPVPAPGAYNVDHSAVLDAKGASMFGKSSVPRFAIDARALEMEPVFSEEELVLAAGGAAGTTARSTTRPQTRQYPRVPVSSKPGTAFAPPPVLGKFGSKPGTSSSTTGGAFTHPVTVVLGCHPKVVVKPLTLGPTPPSIPSPLVSFGFAEDAATGRLVARNLKMKKVTPLKSPLGMSVRRAQTADHHHSESGTTNSKNILPGPTFSKHAGHDLDQFLIMPTGGKGGNLVSKPRRPQDGTLAAHMTALQLEQEKNPAPNSYDISAGEKWISTHGPSVKSYRMGDVALPRFAELAEKQTVKNGIPGPAVYTATNPIDDFLCRITDGKVNTNSSNTPRFVEKTPEVPAPNTYTIQLNTTNRTPAGRDSPFGTSGRRFEQTMFKSTNARLGPGSYKSDVVTSMAYQTHKRVATCSPASRSFGMAGERFPYRLNKTPQTPGPTAYQVASSILRTNTASSSVPRSKLHSRYGKRGTTAPTTLSGRLTMAAGIQPTALVGIPDRFESEQANHNVPPPGAYNVAQAYDQVAERGKLAIRSAFTAEQSPKARANKTRPTYFDRVESRSPGPSWYDMPQADKPEYNKFLAEGAPSQDKEVGFLGRAPRVPESARQAVKNSSMPAPNNYSVDQHSLDKNVQKTFNVTLTRQKAMP